MFSIQAKLLIIAVFLGTLVIFLLQNTQPIPFILLSYVIPRELSVGILVLFAVLAGILTSLILQLLNQGKNKQTPQFSTTKNKKTTETNYNYSPSPRSYNQAKSDIKESSYSRQEYLKKEKIEDVKSSANDSIKEIFDEKIPREENSQVNEPLIKKDSIYSYNFRQNKDKKNNPTDDVYDANYRVIIPPYQQDKEKSSTNIQDDKDEDWI